MKEKEIIEHLKKKYDPVGVILTGSRVNNEETPWSDWDLTVFTDKTEKEVKDFSDLRGFGGEALEISPESANVPSTFILKTSYHPANEARILFDRSEGLMEQIVENTKKAYAKGPEKRTERHIDLYRKILNKFFAKSTIPS